MSKVKSFLLAAIFALAAFFVVSCASLAFSQGPNFKKAEKLYNSAVTRKNKYGENDEKALDLYAQAIDEYKKCTTVNDQNTGKAYYEIGYILYDGPKALRNYPEAIEYFNGAIEIYEKEKKKAVNDVYYSTGRALYRLGDYKSSYDIISKVDFTNNMYSSFYAEFVGSYYWLGLGVEQDLPKAMEIYKTAALVGGYLWNEIYALDYQINELKKGNYGSEGMFLYMEYLHTSNMGEPTIPILTESADSGWVPAQVQLWIKYRISGEYDKGLPYLQKAVAANYIPAFYEMGVMYHNGYGTKIDYAQAKNWYEKAAVEGHPYAQNNLGYLYNNNKIAAVNGYSNQDMAYYWYTESANQGFTMAKKNMDYLVNQQSQSNLSTAVQILNSLASITSASAQLYNSLNKSNVQGYVPTTSTQQTTQNNASTTRTTSSTGTLCPSCSGDGKCHNRYNLSVCDKGNITCHVCHGDGYVSVYGNEKKICSTCHGHKVVTCGVCNGSGVCSRCKGKGRI